MAFARVQYLRLVDLKKHRAFEVFGETAGEKIGLYESD
jgi:hypothetical protein